MSSLNKTLSSSIASFTQLKYWHSYDLVWRAPTMSNRTSCRLPAKLDIVLTNKSSQKRIIEGEKEKKSPLECMYSKNLIFSRTHNSKTKKCKMLLTQHYIIAGVTVKRWRDANIYHDRWRLYRDKVGKSKILCHWLNYATG